MLRRGQHGLRSYAERLVTYPTTRSELLEASSPLRPLPAAEASLVSEIELVLLPRMAEAGSPAPKRWNRPVFISGISGIALAAQLSSWTVRTPAHLDDELSVLVHELVA